MECGPLLIFPIHRQQFRQTGHMACSSFYSRSQPLSGFSIPPLRRRKFDCSWGWYTIRPPFMAAVDASKYYPSDAICPIVLLCKGVPDSNSLTNIPPEGSISWQACPCSQLLPLQFHGNHIVAFVFSLYSSACTSL